MGHSAHKAAAQNSKEENLRAGRYGGVSDGVSGCAAMDFQRNGLAARKAWFFFDDGFLTVGAGISHAGEEEVTTSLDQCLLEGSVHVSSQENALPQTWARNLDEVRWVWHNEVAYAFPEPQTVVLANEARTGNWKDIGVVNRRENKDIFGLWISHGRGPPEFKSKDLGGTDSLSSPLWPSPSRRPRRTTLTGLSLIPKVSFCLAANGADLPKNQWEIIYALLRLLFRAQAVTEFPGGEATPAAICVDKARLRS
ncbi:MAG: polysaccharide lyase family 8 super-sandwich domain-containing protein [Verrucomicrobiia bacterium]